MTEISGEHLIEVRAGSAKPPTMRVRPGEPLGPMSVGSEGAWRLEAPGVAAEHAEIYFDGKELFVRSMNAVIPAVVDGRPMPGTWTSVAAPCEIVMGDARIGFGPDQRGAAGQAPPAPISREGMFEDDDNVATRVAEPTVRPYGDVSALVQRGIEVSRANRGGTEGLGFDAPAVDAETLRDNNNLKARLAALRPGAPRPAAGEPAAVEPPPFFPPSPPAPEPPDPDSFDGPSKSGPTDNSAMTRIEPIDQVSARRKGEEAALKTSGSYPQAALPSGSYPQAALPSGSYPQAALPSGSYPQAALSSTGLPQFGASPDGPITGRPLGTTVVLADGTNSPSSSQSGGLEPLSSPPSFGIAPRPLQTGATPLGIQGFRLEQPTSIDGLEGTPPPPAKSGWREMSLPKKLLAVLFLPMIASVVVIFMGNDLGITGKPKRRPTAAASAKPSSAKVAAAPPSTAPSGLPSAPVAVSAEAPPATAIPPSTAAPSEPPPVAADAPPAVPSTGVVVPETPSPADAQPENEKPGKGKTLQREAADAVASGAYAKAAELYEQLAKKYPTKPAYAEAAAILRDKANGPK